MPPRGVREERMGRPQLTFFLVAWMLLLHDVSSETAALTECYHEPDASDYRGAVNTTQMGLACQPWTAQFPHSHRTPMVEEYGIGDHNYCRNPDLANTAWCFTDDPQFRLQYCDVGPPGKNCPTDPPPTPPPSPIVGDVHCGSSIMTVYLNTSHFDDDFETTDLHFIDESCVAFDHSEGTVALSTRYDQCMTTTNTTDDHIIYSNAIVYVKKVSVPGTIITRNMIQIMIRTHCELPRRQRLTTTFSPESKREISERGYGNFTVSMDQYRDTSYDKEEDDGQVVKSQDRLFFALNMTAPLGLQAFVENCWSTPNPDPLGNESHSLINDGCETDDTVETYITRETGTFKPFSFDAFAFADDPEAQVYVHCELVVCFEGTDGSRCTQGCMQLTSRRRRAARLRGQSSSPHIISKGPIIVDNSADDTQATNRRGVGTTFQRLLPSLCVAGGGCIVGAGIFTAIILLRRSGLGTTPA